MMWAAPAHARRVVGASLTIVLLSDWNVVECPPRISAGGLFLGVLYCRRWRIARGTGAWMFNPPPQVISGFEYTVCSPGDTGEMGRLLSESFTRRFLLGVAEQFARRKIGQHLVATCLANGADRGSTMAVTEATNPVSQHIFGQLGFDAADSRVTALASGAAGAVPRTISLQGLGERKGARARGVQVYSETWLS